MLVRTIRCYQVENPVCPNLIKWLGLFEVTWLIVGVACKHLIHIVGINFIGIIDKEGVFSKPH
jgi:hypothetical protein